METLKRNLLISALLILTISGFSQPNNQTQIAFGKSYEAENAKNYTSAINEIKSIYEANNYVINIRLGWLNYLAKQYNESINYYEKAIALKPYGIEARLGSVKPLSALENWEKVKKQYLEILTIDPQNTLANYWLGVIYYNRKDFVNAGKLFEKIVNLYPLDYDSIIILGWTKLYNNKPLEAKSLFQQALIIKPNDASAISGLKLVP
jgi:tetratricopeptide (TPR) repeat protein